MITILINNALANRRTLSSGVTIGRARRAVHAGPALWGGQNLPDADAVFKKVMLALYITINLEIRSLDYENRNLY